MVAQFDTGILKSPYFQQQGGQAMGISKTRGFLYWLARLLGNVSAVQKGKVALRVERRLAGKATGRALRRLFK
jgi:hypothetical protein